MFVQSQVSMNNVRNLMAKLDRWRPPTSAGRGAPLWVTFDQEKRKVFQINTCPPSHYQFNHIWFLLQNCFFCLFLLVDLLNKNTSLNTQELNVPRRALLLSKNFAQGAIYSSAALIALTRAIILSSVSDRQNQTMTQTSLSHWQVSTYQFRLDPSELSLSVLCLPWKGDFSTFFLESYVFLSRSKRLCISFSPTTVIIR